MIRILVIDDDRHMRNACSRVLARSGWEVICAETGEEGFRFIKDSEQQFDVILIDWLMPGGMSGMEFLARTRALGLNPQPESAEIIRSDRDRR